MEHQLIATRQGYRICRACLTEKPLDRVHYRDLFAAVCLACEFEQTYRTGVVITVTPAATVIESESASVPLLSRTDLGGVMHDYAGGSDEVRAASPEERRKPSLAEFQQHTWMLWRRAVEHITARHGADTEAYHAACEALLAGMPHADEWKDKVQHASFASLAEKFIKGEL